MSTPDPTADIAAGVEAPITPGRPFERGRSGNPSGKPKTAPDPGQLARKHTSACIKALARALTSPDLQASVAAAEVLLNQGYGVPRQHLALGLPRLSLYLHAPPDDAAAGHTNGEDKASRAWDA